MAVRSFLITVCGALLLLLSAPAALAHDALKSSSPAKDAKVSSLETIELEFTSKVQVPVVVLRTKGGESVKLGKAEVDERTVTAEVTEPLPSGAYVIGWRVVSSDGHPITGEIPFTVKAADPTPTPSEETSAPAASESAAPATSVSPAPAPAAEQPAADATPASAEESDGGLPTWVWVVGALLVVLGVGAWLATRRR
ncbi:copper resistance CopC family protein [Nonomuraea longicatena]|uniref:CopC domain-containing protein n=1 Tax=Nonomuraea longicatena TaxID=83682 RepID=A0ABN1QJY9_9ACTN